MHPVKQSTREMYTSEGMMENGITHDENKCMFAFD